MTATFHDTLREIKGYKYLAIDPGKTSGWALFASDGYLRAYGQTEDIYTFLRKIEPKPHVIIYEDYVINPKIRQGGTRPVASIAIGHIEAFAREHEIELVNQYPSIKSIGYLWAKIQPTKNHSISHQRDAIAHGTYYIINNRIRPLKHKTELKGEE